MKTKASPAGLGLRFEYDGAELQLPEEVKNEMKFKIDSKIKKGGIFE